MLKGKGFISESLKNYELSYYLLSLDFVGSVSPASQRCSSVFFLPNTWDAHNKSCEPSLACLFPGLS